jgi:hypothetical protein
MEKAAKSFSDGVYSLADKTRWRELQLIEELFHREIEDGMRAMRMR